MEKISQKIIDYAIWYYLKYYPSPKKLSFKLKELFNFSKFGPKSENGKKYWWITDDDIDFIIREKLFFTCQKYNKGGRSNRFKN